MTLRLSIDRFEGDRKQTAVLLTDDGTPINFPKGLPSPSGRPLDSTICPYLNSGSLAIGSARGFVFHSSSPAAIPCQPTPNAGVVPSPSPTPDRVREQASLSS